MAWRRMTARSPVRPRLDSMRPMRRFFRQGAPALIAAGLLAGWCAPAVAEPDPAAPVGRVLGGTASRDDRSGDAFRLPPPGLGAAVLARFFAGQRLFNLAWVRAPSPLLDTDGLGPTFNRVSCGRCHEKDGRGRPPVADGPMMSMLVRLAVAGNGPHGGPRPHPVYGDQLQDRANPGVPPEGRATLAWREVTGRYADGAPFRLRKPVVALKDLAFGPAEGILASARVAPQLVGLGLLAAVPEASILAAADPDDRDGDGISGRANRVWDATTRRLVLGRFGWKAGQPSLVQQTARALSADMGLTTRLYPHQNCPPAQAACRRAPTGGDPEVEDGTLRELAFYVSLLAVPHRRGVDRPAVRHGESLFTRIGCAACHRPTLATGPHPSPALSRQTIHPFTDLLLHDMGPGLADGFPEFGATGREWRTPPLWGIGLFRAVNGHTFYLHDGRARSLAEAVLWHGGEARAARERFRSLPKSDRDALIAFLESL